MKQCSVSSELVGIEEIDDNLSGTGSFHTSSRLDRKTYTILLVLLARQFLHHISSLPPKTMSSHTQTPSNIDLIPSVFTIHVHPHSIADIHLRVHQLDKGELIIPGLSDELKVSTVHMRSFGHSVEVVVNIRQ